MSSLKEYATATQNKKLLDYLGEKEIRERELTKEETKKGNNLVNLLELGGLILASTAILAGLWIVIASLYVRG